MNGYIRGGHARYSLASGASRFLMGLDTAHLGDAEVGAGQQRYCPLATSRLRIGIRRFAIRDFELAAEVSRRHAHTAGERFDVKRLRVLSIDRVADAARAGEVAKTLSRGGSAGHVRGRATPIGVAQRHWASRRTTASYATPAFGWGDARRLL